MTDGVAANWALKEEVREYWSKRAETFDLSPGHRIRSEAERALWREALGRALGPANGGQVLDLACGTGEITGVLLDLGCTVTGLDFAEPMLARSRAKHAGKPRARFFAADAEDTREPDGAYDAIVTRHLVWTLLDPQAAFRDWHRVLRPGGRLVVVDGDWVDPSWPTRLQRRLGALLDRLGAAGGRSSIDTEAHRRILDQVHFRAGLRQDRLQTALEIAGFGPFETWPVRAIRKVQRRHASVRERLRMASGFDHEFLLAAART